MNKKKLGIILTVAIIFTMFQYGQSIFYYGISGYNYLTKEDNHKDISAHCNEWKDDPYFQEQVKNLPDNPAVIEFLLDRGQIYKYDPEIYCSIDYCPHLNEIQFTFPSEITRGSYISFVGDCVTKTVLFGNILSCKGIPFKIIHTFSYKNIWGHSFIDYEGRQDTKQKTITYKVTTTEITCNNETYVLRSEPSKEEDKISLFGSNDLRAVYEGKDFYRSYKLSFLKGIFNILLVVLGTYLLLNIKKIYLICKPIFSKVFKKIWKKIKVLKNKEALK